MEYSKLKTQTQEEKSSKDSGGPGPHATILLYMSQEKKIYKLKPK